MKEFPVTPAGYARVLEWLGGFGTISLGGIEGTGSYGAGLSRQATVARVNWVVEAARSDRQDRRRQGKSDPLDAVTPPALPGTAVVLRYLAGRRGLEPGDVPG